MSDLNVATLLATYDKFLSGAQISEAEEGTARLIMRAASFGAAAYDASWLCDGQRTHAMIRSVLIALIDPMDARLDYLRAEPDAAVAAREAAR